jgi:lipopolysaccharide export system permease protein
MIGWTLGRYFFARYATITAWIFLGIFALVFIIDFTEFSSRFGNLNGYSIRFGLGVSALRIAMVMEQTVPFIALVAAMATLVSLNRKYELVIARSAGVSAWQFLLPIALGAFLFGLLTIGVLNPVAAAAFAKAESLTAELRSGKSSVVSGPQTPWLKQRTDQGATIIGAKAILDQGLTLSDATFFRIDAAGDITERLDARRAHLRDGHWELTEVTRRAEGDEPERLESAEVKTNLRPEFVQERLAQPEMIPIYQLGQKIDAARSFGLRADAFAMHYHSLLALPALLVAMTLIAATVCMRFTRMGQSGPMILGGILAGFLLYVVSVLVEAFGSAGIVAPVLAAWFPVVVAMFFGVTFLLHKEDG